MEEVTLPVGSERYIFKKTWDAECYEGEAPYAFSDVLDDYTFWPYSGKLKALPGYEGNEDKSEVPVAHICNLFEESNASTDYALNIIFSRGDVTGNVLT